MRIQIAPNQAALDAIQKRLSEMGKEDTFGNVLKKAINEVATAGKNLLYSETRSEYTIKPVEFKKSDIVRKGATARKLIATLSVRGETPGIRKAYKTRKNSKRKSAGAMVIKSGAMKELELKANGKSYKAFVAKMKTGHEGIFQRTPGKYMKGYSPSGKTKGREAIKEIMAMSKAKAAEMVYEKGNLYSDLQEEISYRLLKHMNAVIGGGK